MDATIAGIRRYPGRVCVSRSKAKNEPVAAVVTVTVAVLAVPAPTETVLGVTAHVDDAGPPLQLNATVCVNPPIGATAIV
jgi:hypothetical protein